VNGLHSKLYFHDLAAATWRKSSASGAENNCVEITGLPTGGIAVRDSKDLHREPLRFDVDEWAAFREGVLDGEF